MMLIFAPSWDWIVAANVVLGISQGPTWSTTVMMKMDLVGPERRRLHRRRLGLSVLTVRERTTMP